MTDTALTRQRRTPAELEALCHSIIERIRSGESLAGICRAEGLNFGSTWQRLAKPDLFPAYEEAFLARAHMWFEQLMDVSDDKSGDLVEDKDGNQKGNMAAVARARLQADSRKWALTKLLPRQYGDTVALTGADGGPMQISWAEKPILDITPDEQDK